MTQDTPTPTIPAGMVARADVERFMRDAFIRGYQEARADHPDDNSEVSADLYMIGMEFSLAAAPKQAEQQGVERAIDWLVIAKLAGLHGIRYRTNTSLLQFFAALPPEYLRTIAVERCDVWMRHLRAALEDSETLETNEIKLAVEHAVQLNADVDAWEEADAALNAPTGAVEKGGSS